MNDLPHVTRVRHDTTRRQLTVTRVDHPAPKMVRVALRGGEPSIDFYLHEAGPAARWPSQVAVAQNIAVGRPRGSSVISIEGIDVHVLVADETALPAIDRHLEELPSKVRAFVVLDIEEAASGYLLASAAQFEVVKATAGDTATRADRIIEALRNLRIPTGSCFTWVATESHVARAICRYLMSERGIDKRWIKCELPTLLSRPPEKVSPMRRREKAVETIA